LYVIEANPRASRTVPFVSKATSVPLAKAASRVMMGATIAELREEGMIPSNFDGGSLPADAPIAVKEAVLPFNRFRDFEGRALDSLLSPEMKSTGEVMGLADNFGAAFAKGELAGFGELPTEGTIFVSLANRDKRTLVFPILTLADMGFRILATEGTAGMLRRNGVECEVVAKRTTDSEAPTDERDIVDMIRDGEVDIIINTPSGSAGARSDGYEIRAAAVSQGVTCVTTAQGAVAALQGILALRNGEMSVKALQELHPAELAAQEQA
ncbi:MAG: carbamoyl phosphate synthase large subunit, partial [Corynebacterium sp.]|nr:carbamoyl phosphate synthase large subunit [Corynebacterium sp.]